MDKLHTFIKTRFAGIKADFIEAPGNNQLQKASVAYDLMSLETSVCKGAIFYAEHTNQITKEVEETAKATLNAAHKEVENFITRSLDARLRQV